VYALYVRTKRWKYVLYTQDLNEENEPYIKMPLRLFDLVIRDQGDQELFDLDVDPYERNNLAAKPGQEERIAELRQQTLDWWKRTGGGPLKDVN
jgi:hypothetical protein